MEASKKTSAISPSAKKVSKNATKEIVKEAFVTQENVSKRKAIKLENIQTQSNDKRNDLNGPVLWFDTATLHEMSPADDIYARIINLQYSGIILYLEHYATFVKTVPARMKVIVKLRDEKEFNAFISEHSSTILKEDSERFIIWYGDTAGIKQLKEAGHLTCYSKYVDDNASLHDSIYEGLDADYLSVKFKDPTNIPLELVIASLQKTGTILMKEITDPCDTDDALVTLGVMEYGAEGVVFSPNDQQHLDAFVTGINGRQYPNMNLEVGRVVSTSSVGMGYRACIDTATLFDDDEGILVGSTSEGGILCCPEVYFLPYMELRPFRVNAGAVHSYVYNVEDKTDYMSELKAGSPVMLVKKDGSVRTVPVGRMKIEKRPLRLIEVAFDSGKTVNVMMQDDWHVRIFSDKGTPLNISELKEGDKVLGYTTESGRHVGIKIDENIIEK